MLIEILVLKCDACGDTVVGNEGEGAADIRRRTGFDYLAEPHRDLCQPCYRRAFSSLFAGIATPWWDFPAVE